MDSAVTGMVFDIKKFAIHDGPGIRTSVFVKGCPLSCLWCHNPESQRSEPELSFLPDKCIGCGWCFQQCPTGAHLMKDGKHTLDRSKCTVCGKCVEQCYAGALSMIGKTVTVEEALEEVLKDKPFYETSNGGMTISGGEPMQQFEFTSNLLQAAKEAGLHNCLDTCGFAPRERYMELLPYVDVFLYDLKETNPENHEKYTGVPLQPILDNLKAIDQAGGAIMLRCPIIPGLNDREEHLKQIAAVANKLSNVKEINLMGYHPLGDSKLERLGKDATMDKQEFVADSIVSGWIDIVAAETSIPVSKG